MRLADVFGLASFLKEERGCRVLLISNQEKLNREARDELRTYLEKVVEETVDFAPTPAEACSIALGTEPNDARRFLGEKMERLNVSNIRVIARLALMADELAGLLKNLHPKVVEDAINTLALFGVSHFQPSIEFPPPSFLLKYGFSWDGYLGNENEVQTEDEKKEEGWRKLVSEYGYAETNAVDVEIYGGVKAGFFDDATLVDAATPISLNAESFALKSAFNHQSKEFWWSIHGDSTAVLNELHRVTTAALHLLSAAELHQVHSIYEALGRQGDAAELWNAFTAANQHRPDVFQVSDSFGPRFEEEFATRLDEEYRKLAPPPDVPAALDAIDFSRGWNPEDTRTVGSAGFSAVLPILQDSNGNVFSRRLATVLKIGLQKDASAAEKELRLDAIVWLKALSASHPVLAIRMGRFVPAEAGAKQDDAVAS